MRLLALLFFASLALADTPPPIYNFQSPITKSGVNVSCQAASGSQPGCLAAADWTTFNGKQAAISGNSCSANQWANSISAAGAISCTQPAYSNISGTPTIYYQTLQANTTAQTQRANLNFSTNFGLTDSSANNRSTVDLAATISSNISGTAATATAPASGSAHGNVTLNSSGNFQTIAPGTAGHVVRSNGTDYVDAAIAVGDLPSPFTSGTISGNTSKFGTTSGTLTSGDCVKIDASGNLVDAGAACGTGGAGTVTSVSMPAQWTVTNPTAAVSIASPPPNTTAKTANYSMTTSDYEIRVNCSSACTITMPAPGSTTKGAHYIVRNYATTTYALVTIAAHASETFCASAYASVHVSTPEEWWEFVDDGTNWSCAEHHTQTVPKSYTLTIGASTTPPTMGTLATNSAYWSRNGADMTIHYALAQTAGGSVAGSGTFEFPIFTGTSSSFQINTTAAPASTNAATGVAAIGQSVTVGSGMFFASCQTTKGMQVLVYDTSNLKMWVDHDDSFLTSTYCTTFGTSTLVGLSFGATVPITNWEP